MGVVGEGTEGGGDEKGGENVLTRRRRGVVWSWEDRKKEVKKKR